MSRSGCARRGTTPRTGARALTYAVLIDRRAGRLDRSAHGEPARATPSLRLDRARRVRAGRPDHRRTGRRPHAVAPAPHRRAVRAARHHHARRDRSRHHPRDLGGRRGAGMGRRGRARHRRRHHAGVRPVVGVLHDAVGRRARPAPRRGLVWGYGHIVLFGALAAIGAGLHVAAYVIEGVAHIDDTLATAHRRRARRRVLGRAVHASTRCSCGSSTRSTSCCSSGASWPLVARGRGVAGGTSMGTGIVVAALSPIVIVVGYETVGHRHQAPRSSERSA